MAGAHIVLMMMSGQALLQSLPDFAIRHGRPLPFSFPVAIHFSVPVPVPICASGQPRRGSIVH